MCELITVGVIGMDYYPWQPEFYIEQERQSHAERRPLTVYLVDYRSFTHYYKKGQFHRGATVGTLTSLISSALADGKFKFVPMLDPSEIAKMVGKNRSDVIIELARKYGVPSFPIAATDKVARWLILPTKGFLLYLQAHGLCEYLRERESGFYFALFIEISGFPERFQRKLLVRCAANGIRWRKIGNHVFVPLGSIFTDKTQMDLSFLRELIPALKKTCSFIVVNEFKLKSDEIYDLPEPVGGSVDTIVKKGFMFLRQEIASKAKVERVSDGDLLKKDLESEDSGTFLRELFSDRFLSNLLSLHLSFLETLGQDKYNTFMIDLLQMYCEHVAASVFGSDEQYGKAYALVIANTADDLTCYAFKKQFDHFKPDRFEDGDPSVRMLVAERQRLTARIYKRQKNHAYRERKFPSKQEPAPLLRKFVEHAKNLLVNKFQRLWADESGSKTGVTVDLHGEFVRVAVSRECFDVLMERLSSFLIEKFGEPATLTFKRIITKSLIRWLIETFGMAGFKVVVGNVTERFRKAFELAKEKEGTYVPHFVAFVERILLPQTVPRLPAHA